GSRIAQGEDAAPRPRARRSVRLHPGQAGPPRRVGPKPLLRLRVRHAGLSDHRLDRDVPRAVRTTTMIVRHTLYLIAGAIALAASACTPGVPSSPPPRGSVVTAVFDPPHSQIPLPNDLVLTMDPSTLDVPPAQAELLSAFIAQRGFPNDQEVAL